MREDGCPGCTAPMSPYEKLRGCCGYCERTGTVKVKRAEPAVNSRGFTASDNCMQGAEAQRAMPDPIGPVAEGSHPAEIEDRNSAIGQARLRRGGNTRPVHTIQGWMARENILARVQDPGYRAEAARQFISGR